MPYCFEMKMSDGSRQFVEVVGSCKHHYTNETMRYVRIHRRVGDSAECEYTFVNQAMWEQMLARRVIAE